MPRETLDPARELGVALRQHLEQREGEAWPVPDELLHFGNIPTHHRGTFDSRGAFRTLGEVEKCRLAEQLVGPDDLQQHLFSVFGDLRDPYSACDHQIDTPG